MLGRLWNRNEADDEALNDGEVACCAIDQSSLVFSFFPQDIMEALVADLQKFDGQLVEKTEVSSETFFRIKLSPVLYSAYSSPAYVRMMMIQLFHSLRKLSWHFIRSLNVSSAESHREMYVFERGPERPVEDTIVIAMTRGDKLRVIGKSCIPVAQAIRPTLATRWVRGTKRDKVKELNVHEFKFKGWPWKHSNRDPLSAHYMIHGIVEVMCQKLGYSIGPAFRMSHRNDDLETIMFEKVEGAGDAAAAEFRPEELPITSVSNNHCDTIFFCNLPGDVLEILVSTFNMTKGLKLAKVKPMPNPAFTKVQFEIPLWSEKAPLEMVAYRIMVKVLGQCGWRSSLACANSLMSKSTSSDIVFFQQVEQNNKPIITYAESLAFVRGSRLCPSPNFARPLMEALQDSSLAVVNFKQKEVGLQFALPENSLIHFESSMREGVMQLLRSLLKNHALALVARISHWQDDGDLLIFVK